MIENKMLAGRELSPENWFDSYAVDLDQHPASC